MANLSDLERVWPCPVCGEVYLTKQLLVHPHGMRCRLEAHAEREHLQEEMSSEDSVDGMTEETQQQASRVPRASRMSRASSPLKPIPECGHG